MSKEGRKGEVGSTGSLVVAPTQLSGLAPTMLEQQLGHVAGFELLECIGSGGMGKVFAANRHTDNERVALKLMLGEKLGQLEAQRFSREAEVLSRLAHPGIVRYIEHGVSESGEAFLAMEWLEGVDLARRLTRGRLTIDETNALAERVAGALSAAHSVGVVHRDIKPANIFLIDGLPRKATLLDFGVARYLQQTHTLTRTGGIIGTPGYMSPEQACGSPNTDSRSDLFSLGCVLYECLTGTPAFPGGHVMAVLARVLLEDVPRAKVSVPETPKWLDTLIARLLEKEPGRRPETAAKVVDLLRAKQGPPDSVENSNSPRLTEVEQELLSVIFAVLPNHVKGTARASSLLTSIAREHGGTLVELVDGSMLVSLAPQSTSTTVSDRAALAARCALAIRDCFPDTALVLVSGFGVHSQGTIIGNVIERGANVLSSAAVGMILIDDDTAAFLETSFRISRLEGRIALEGTRSGPLTPRTLLGRETPCVGRGRELGALEGLLGEVVDESCAGSVIVIGEAGVGKSRLRYEFVRRVIAGGDTHKILVCRGDPLYEGAPFHLAVQALRQAVGIRESDPLDVRRRKLSKRLRQKATTQAARKSTPYLLEMLGSSGSEVSADMEMARHEPAIMRERIAKAWCWWLSLEISNSTVILILEDLHWSDRASIELVDSSLRELEDMPFFVLALTRPNVFERFPDLWAQRDPEVLHLQPLTRRASRRLAKSVLGTELDTSVFDRLFAASRGNAFFLEELLRTARSPGGVQADIPETVLGMMESRMQTLPERARAALRAASVFGLLFWNRGVQALYRDTGLFGLISQLAKEEWITPRTESSIQGCREYVFRHALVCDAAYSTLTPQDREVGHRLAAHWLEDSGFDDAPVLARHFSLGARPERSLPWFTLAATQSLEGNDLDRAVAFATSALSCNPGGHQKSELHSLIGEAQISRGYFDDAVEHLLEAIGAIEEGSIRWFDVLRHLFEALGRRGRFHELDKWISETLQYELVPPDAKIRALCQLGTHFTYNGRLMDSERIAHHVDKLALESVELQPLTSIDYHRMWAIVLDEKGFPERGLKHAELARDAARSVQLLRAELDAELLLGHFSAQLGAMRKARIHYGIIVQHCERVGTLAWGLGAYIALGIFALREGRLDEAEGYLDRCASMSVGQHPRYEGTRLAVYARVACAKGDLERAIQLGKSAEEMLRIAPPLHVFGMAALAEALLKAERIDEALRMSTVAYANLEKLGSISEFELVVRAIHVRILQTIDNDVEARVVLKDSLSRLTERVNAIESNEFRASFIQEVPEHRWLIEQAKHHKLDS